MRIAILDDDSKQTALVFQTLTASGHHCTCFQNTQQLFNQLHKENCDMLILDWQMPDLNGSEVLHWMRKKISPHIPVLLMTSSACEDDIVNSFTAGANDYLIKPIRRNELAIRVQILLRRTYRIQKTNEQIVFNDYLFETHTNRLIYTGNPINVTQKEFELALLFFRNIGRPLSRAYILDAIWSRDINIPSRTIDTHVSRVRNKLHLKPENGYRLAPVYSYGYRLEQLVG